MNPLDIVVILFLAISALLAFARGFVREILSLGAWIISGVIAAKFYATLDPTMREWIKAAWLADLVTIAVLFVASLFVLSVIVGFISGRVRGSSFGGTDRVLGLLFGLARAAIVLCLGYLLADRLVPHDNWPSWAAEARSRPLIASGAATLEHLIPREVLDQSTRAIDKAGKDVQGASDAAGLAHSLTTDDPPPPRDVPARPAAPHVEDFDALRRPPPARSTPASGPGYDAEAVREMDRAFQSVGGDHK